MHDQIPAYFIGGPLDGIEKTVSASTVEGSVIFKMPMERDNERLVPVVMRYRYERGLLNPASGTYRFHFKGLFPIKSPATLDFTTLTMEEL